jgi:hypothetical protein
MTPIEVLKMLQSKIDEANFYKTNYVLQTNDIEMIAEALHIHDVLGRSEQLPCDECVDGEKWSPYYAKYVKCDCRK